MDELQTLSDAEFNDLVASEIEMPSCTEFLVDIIQECLNRPNIDHNSEMYLLSKLVDLRIAQAKEEYISLYMKFTPDLYFACGVWNVCLSDSASKAHIDLEQLSETLDLLAKNSAAHVS